MQRFPQKVFFLLLWLSAVAIVGSWMYVDRVRSYIHKSNYSLMKNVERSVEEEFGIETAILKSTLNNEMSRKEKAPDTKSSMVVPSVCDTNCFPIGSVQPVITSELENESDWFAESNSKESEPWFVIRG